MIPETQQDLAIAYLLGDLDPAQTARFEGDMETDAELMQFVDELRETIAALALALPTQKPSPQLRAKILAGLHAPPAEAARPPGQVIAGPWQSPVVGGLAACLVLTLGYALYQNHVARDELQDGNAKAALFAKTIDGLSREFAQLRTTSETQLKLLADLQAQDSLARMRIATLAAQVDTYQRAGVVVVWDELKQQGLAKLVNLPKPAAGRDYQLWIVDPKYPNPVNGGILTVTDEAGTVASFKPDQPVTSATAFAISVEKTGGVPKAEGPIVFVGK